MAPRFIYVKVPVAQQALSRCGFPSLFLPQHGAQLRVGDDWVLEGAGSLYEQRVTSIL